MATQAKQIPPPAAAAPAQLRMLTPSALQPWPGLNPRRHFDAARMAELAASIREKGVLQPLLVHAPDDWATPWIVAGESRWRAAVKAGAAEIPCMCGTYTEAEALEVALLENVQRRDLSVLEEARGYQRWLDAAPAHSQRMLAERIGVAQPTIANRVRLLELPEDVLQIVEDDLLTPSQARDLLLPFARVTVEKPREAFFAAVVKQIRADAPKRGGPNTTQHTRDTVSRIAARFTGPIDAQDAGYQDSRPRFASDLHQQCGCGGPQFAYGWADKRATVRCWDPAWWDAAQQEAIRQEEVARKAARKRAKEQGGAPPREMTHAEFHERYAYPDYEPIGANSGLLDPEPLARAPLVRVSGRGGGVYCVDPAAVRRAKAAATRERNRILGERRAERAKRDLAAVRGTEVEPWMLSELLGRRVDRETMGQVGQDLGLEIPKQPTETDLLKVPKAQLYAWIAVMAIRARRGELGWQDPLERQVTEELRSRYAPGLRALLPETNDKTEAETAQAEVREIIESLLAELKSVLELDGSANPAEHREGVRHALQEVREWIAEHDLGTMDQGKTGLSLNDTRLLERAEAWLTPETAEAAPAEPAPPAPDLQLDILEGRLTAALGIAEREDTEQTRAQLGTHLEALRNHLAEHGMPVSRGGSVDRLLSRAAALLEARPKRKPKPHATAREEDPAAALSRRLRMAVDGAETVGLTESDERYAHGQLQEAYHAASEYQGGGGAVSRGLERLMDDAEALLSAYAR